MKLNSQNWLCPTLNLFANIELNLKTTGVKDIQHQHHHSIMLGITIALKLVSLGTCTCSTKQNLYGQLDIMVYTNTS